eukprot:TRINITY_DN81366_c0_g1_i1.p1 TRINITY_DN81366_c0_g1~~TRINITY_DN81366_c0_g1_i1.p1  ORF type:complete len:335 (+),score=41.69 TRINITY_DN81366_c0_g1_i1:127-1005(+)
MHGVKGPVQMPLVGLGTWQYNDSVVEQIIPIAFGLGYRHVDTAQVYKNQVGVRYGLSRAGLDRKEYFVTSKIPGGLNASATGAALDSCLQDLALDYVDLMLIHFPQGDDAAMQESWLALEAWAKAGKARAIGISHFCRHHIDNILAVATLPIALSQEQYHVGMGTDTQPRLHDKTYAESKGILYMSYSSLCGPCPPPDNTELITGDLVSGIGRKYNKTGSQVALRWLVQQNIPIIPKSLKEEHIRSNFEVFDFELSEDDMVRLTSATSPAETGTPQKPDDAQDCAATATFVV